MTSDSIVSGQVQDLPKHWVSSIDPDFKRIYYYNLKTGESTWDRPEQGQDLLETIETKEDVETKIETKSKGYFLPATARSLNEETKQDIWVAGYAKDYDREYYFNPTTGESVWEIPEKSNPLEKQKHELQKALEALEKARRELKRERLEGKVEEVQLKKQVNKLLTISSEGRYTPRNVPEDMRAESESSALGIAPSLLRLGEELEEYATYLETTSDVISTAPTQVTAFLELNDSSLVPREESQGRMREMKSGIQAVKAELQAQRAAVKQANFVKGGDYYKILGVPRGATNAQLRKAYHKRMIQWHPDKNQARIEYATKHANLVQDAYAVLSDPWEREVYDSYGLKEYLVHNKTVQAVRSYLLTGVELKKHGRREKRHGIKGLGLTFYTPKRRIFWLDFNEKTLNTGPKRIHDAKSSKERAHIKRISIDSIQEIRKGMSTQVFQRTGDPLKAERYFSIVSSQRTLDLEAASPQARDFLVSRISLLVLDMQKNKEWLHRYYREA